MPEAPNRISKLARRGLVPLSVAALLAFALVPGVAVAEAGIPQYRDAPPTVTGETRDSGPNTGPNAGGGAGDGGQSPTGGGSKDGAKSKDGDGDGQGGAAGGNGKGGGKGGDAAIADGKNAGDGPQTIDPENASSDGGSSPLVPILIALAVLAAISVGVVAMRKKREDADPGAPASPEAG